MCYVNRNSQAGICRLTIGVGRLRILAGGGGGGGGRFRILGGGKGSQFPSRHMTSF